MGQRGGKRRRVSGPSSSPPDAPAADAVRHGPRLRALRRSGLLGTPPEEAFDRLVRLVSRVLRVPVALVSLVDADRQFFKAAVGLPEPWASRRGTPLTHSFCQHVVASGAPFAVGDARAHPVVRDNRAVGDLGVVAYLGMPIASRDGHPIGALCAIDTAPRGWTAEEADTLRDLAHLATDEVALRELGRELDARVDEEVALREAELTERTRVRRLEALGRLAGGVAHDINNVLHAASGGVRLASRRLERDPARASRLLDTALEAMDRGAAVTRRLLSVAGHAVLFPEPVDTATALAEVREALLRGGGAVEVRAEVPDGLPSALADRAQLGAALRALAQNALEATPRGGAFVLAASVEAVPEGCPHPAGLRPGAYLRLDVADSGAGMDRATLARAPEPFFTTKASGTGLGLAAARAFAEQSGGGLAIASEAGRGTTVSLWLPQAEVEQPSADPSRTSARAPPPGGRVLLVDDDPLVLRVLRAQLEEAGHAVTAVGSGAAALSALDDDEALGVLVSDLSMPGMDGLELIRAAQARKPGLPAILLTGHPVGTAAPADGGAQAAPFRLMHKPVSGPYLAEQVAAMLEETSARR